MIALAVALAAIGYTRGLIASALPLAGFLGGAALGARVGPALLAHGAESRYAPLVAVLTGVVIGAFAAVALDGVAQAMRPRIGTGVVGTLDGVGGAALLGALALLLAWGFGAVALHTSGQQARKLRETVQESTILAALNDVLPPSGPLLHVLRRVDPTPPVRGPNANVAPPDAAIANDPDVGHAAQSTVRVLGTACGLGVAGSGWVAGPGLVVTNAHVVAGEDDTTVTPEGGSELDVDVVHYDTRNDLAILSVPGLSLPALDLAGSPEKGVDAAVIGYPENGPLAIAPARLGRTGEVTSNDSYGRGPVTRSMTPFRADVRHGNSGGPVVDATGDVLTTVFAASLGAGHPEGLGVPNDVVQAALHGQLAPTDTGPCAV
ncbi:MAG: MarP family serine protease [Solirubrobacterales bacterium]